MTDDDWHRLVALLPLNGMARQLAQHCEMVEVNASRIVLRLQPMHKHLAGATQQSKLQQALSTHYQRPLQLEIEHAETQAETPAERKRISKQRRHENAVAAIESDSFVREACDLFDASIDESTIRPI